MLLRFSQNCRGLASFIRHRKPCNVFPLSSTRSNHTLLMGAAAAVLLTSQAFSRDQPSCETLATIPLVPQPVIILPKEPTQEKVSSSLWSYFQSSYDWFLNLFQLLKRLTFFSLYFTPTVLTSPILLINSPSLELKWWQLVRWSIFSCGPCLTKFSQWAATRPDIFPTRFCKELELLQAKSYEHSWDETVRIFNEIYGPQWSEVLTLDHKSTSGSGLVAQVYHGYLLPQNTSSLGKNKDKDLSQQRHEVAVKILHPHVRDAMKEDLRLLSFLAQSLETSVSYLTYWYYSIPFLHPALASASVDPSNAAAEVNRASFLDTTISLMDIVREFDSFMTPQLDLRNEVIAMRRFHRNFREGYWKSHVDFAEPIEFPLPILQNASRESIVFDGDSDVYQKYSSEILLETFLEGIPVAQYLTERSQMRNDEKLQSQQRKFDKDIAGLGLDIILKMIFDDNFIHGDMHPGNLLLVPNEIGDLSSRKPRFKVLDYGLTTQLTKGDRENLILLFKAVIDKNGREVGRLMIEKSRIQQQVIDAEGFQEAMQEIVDDAFRDGIKLRNSGVSQLLHRVLNLCYKHRVRLESNFSSVILSIGVIEGLGMQLDPDADVVQRAAPYILRTAAREYGLY